MRRALASLLVAFFSFSLISPALFAISGADLPSCCRRGGKHHCGMGGEKALGDGSARAVSAKCPLYPGAIATPAYSKHILLKFSPARIDSLPAHAIAEIASESHLSYSFNGPVNKRGPPLPL